MRKRGMKISAVTIPFVKWIPETYEVHSDWMLKPHMTLQCMLVHPNDKSTTKEQARMVYQIPCCDCDMVCTGDTGRREKEHKKDVETHTG